MALRNEQTGAVPGLQSLATAIGTFFALRASMGGSCVSASVRNAAGSNTATASDSAIAEWAIKYQGDADVQKWMADNPGKAAFVVPSGDLGLSVIVFCVCAFSCLATLQIRRTVFGGELGGPATPRLATGVFFVALWVIYVTVSGLKSTGKIDFSM